MKDFKLHLHMFDDTDLTRMNTNVTTQIGTGQNLSPEMKTYYSKYLIANAEPELYHDQFGQKHPIPKNGGKTIEFRKYSPLPKAMTKLTEGVTPNGQKLDVSTITATIDQYGGYVTLSDLLMLTAIDNNMLQATELLGSQAGRTSDSITREVINAGTNVIYSQTSSVTPTSRHTVTAACKLTVDDIRKARRLLRSMNAKPFADGYYVAIISPDTEYDLMSDPAWVNASEYAGSTQIFNGEIGRLYGVRFVSTTEAKIFPVGTGSDDPVVPVHSTLVIGKDAYGVTELEGGGLQHIVKQLGSGGTSDPLNQRATVGWKLSKVAEILVNAYMVRIESAATFNQDAT